MFSVNSNNQKSLFVRQFGLFVIVMQKCYLMRKLFPEYRYCTKNCLSNLYHTDSKFVVFLMTSFSKFTFDTNCLRYHEQSNTIVVATLENLTLPLMGKNW